MKAMTDQLKVWAVLLTATDGRVCRWEFNPNRSLGRYYAEQSLSLNSSPASALLSASCLPSRLGVARYAFGESGSQTARHDRRISLKPNDRFGVRGCTLAHVKDLVRGYVAGCPYDCDWTIRGGGMKIQGRSRQDDSGRAGVLARKRPCGKKIAG